MKDDDGSYWLVSEDSKKEVTQSEWEAGPSPGMYRKEVSALGTETRGGTTFGRVSIVALEFPKTKVDGVQCSRLTTTRTWVQERGHWRFRTFGTAKLFDLAEKQEASNDYQAAAETYATILEKHPFAVHAYKQLAFAISARGAKVPGKTAPTLIRDVLKINPLDSHALFTAITYTGDNAAARIYLDLLPPTDCEYSSAVFNVALRQTSPGAVLDFLRTHQPQYDDVSLELVRARALADLNKKADLRAQLTGTMLGKMKQHLAERDPTYEAVWSAVLYRGLNLIGESRAATEFSPAAGRRPTGSTPPKKK